MYTEFFFRSLSNPYCYITLCSVLSVSVPGFTPWSRKFHSKSTVRRSWTSGYVRWLSGGHCDNCYYCRYPKIKLESASDDPAYYIGTGAGRLHMAVLSAPHAIPGPCSQPVHRTDHPCHLRRITRKSTKTDSGT